MRDLCSTPEKFTLDAPPSARPPRTPQHPQNHCKMALVIVVAGTASTGKSTVGIRVAEHFKCAYIEGDDLHPQANIDKMANNIPLQDEDRWDWLVQVSQKSAQSAASGSGYAVVSCSALKEVYREHIKKSSPQTRFVYLFLHAPREELIRRAQGREGHFMKSTMIDSQLSIMELPTGSNALCIDVNGKSVDEIVETGVKFIEGL